MVKLFLILMFTLVKWTMVKSFQSWQFKCQPFVFAFLQWPIYIINAADETKLFSNTPTHLSTSTAPQFLLNPTPTHTHPPSPLTKEFRPANFHIAWNYQFWICHWLDNKIILSCTLIRVKQFCRSGYFICLSIISGSNLVVRAIKAMQEDSCDEVRIAL